MVSATREEGAYRRGLVLGLTMAEIVTLIIFVLLLTLSALLARKDEEQTKLAQKLAQKDEEILVLEEKTKALDQFVGGKDDIDSLFRELVLKRQQVATLQGEKAALVERSKDLERSNEELRSAVEKVRKDSETLTRLEKALEQSGIDTSNPKEMANATGALERASRIEKALVAAGFHPSDTKVFEAEIATASTARDALDSLGDENTTLRERMEYFKRVASGRSNLLPPCWIDPETKKAEYIFDTALTAEGIVVYDRNIPHRLDDKAALPIAGLAFLSPLSGPVFLDQTRALYLWSDERNCRFYVRVFDLTGATEKELYKQRLRTVEGHFYKYEVTDPSITPGG